MKRIEKLKSSIRFLLSLARAQGKSRHMALDLLPGLSCANSKAMHLRSFHQISLNIITIIDIIYLNIV